MAKHELLDDKQKIPAKRTGVVEVPKNKRGRWKQKTTNIESDPVPDAKKVYIFPTFLLNWQIKWSRITNGEMVVIDTNKRCHQKTTNFEIQKFKSHHTFGNTMALIPPIPYHEKSVLKYAHF